MIVFNNVTKKYGDNVGLIDASVHINSGDFVFLVGPSGAGKTTFIKLILKEIEPDSGKILLAGKDITRIRKREVPKIRQKVGMVFQDFRLLEKKTVYENVAFAMEVLHKSRKEIRERVPYVLELVDIADKAKRYPDELSAGEQQRVGIARALVNKPRVLICDEPTGNLDPITAMDIMRLLEQINVRGTTILMVTHAKDIVDKMNKRVVAIDHGRIVRDEEGSYGFEQQTEQEEDLYVPGFTTFLDPNELRAAQAKINRSNENFKGRTVTIPNPVSYDDSLVDTYLSGGEDIYE
jgi:cell division transport system ATP-binding protein